MAFQLEFQRKGKYESLASGITILVITQIYPNVPFGFQPAKSGDSIKPRVERVSCGTLGTLAKTHPARVGGRQSQ